MSYLVVKNLLGVPVARVGRQRGFSTGAHIEYDDGRLKPVAQGVLFAPSLCWQGRSKRTRAALVAQLPLVEARATGRARRPRPRNQERSLSPMSEREQIERAEFTKDDLARWRQQGLDAMDAAGFTIHDCDDAVDTILGVLHAMRARKGYGPAGIEEILSRVTNQARRERILNEV